MPQMNPSYWVLINVWVCLNFIILVNFIYFNYKFD